LREVILPTALPWLRVILAGSVSTESSHIDYHHRIETSTLLRDMIAIARERCEVVIVDTPPGLGAIPRRVLELSQHAIIPLQCEPLALQTTPQMLRGIQEIAASNEELTLDGIVLTMYDPASVGCQRVTEYLRANLPRDMVFDIVIPRSAAASEAFAAGQPVVLRDPADPASQAFVNLATVLAERFT